jgi:hypothetical protein
MRRAGGRALRLPPTPLRDAKLRATMPSAAAVASGSALCRFLASSEAMAGLCAAKRLNNAADAIGLKLAAKKGNGPAAAASPEQEAGKPRGETWDGETDWLETTLFAEIVGKSARQDKG